MARMRFVSAIAIVLGLVIAISQAALASDPVPFTQQAFAAAQKEGKPILVDVAADWCPVCAKQHPIIAQLASDPAFRDFVFYKVDFDTQKDVVRSLNVRWQSTLIAFRGAAESGRSTGDTNPDSIRALLLKAQ